MNTEHTTAFISLGSNLGDRAGNLLLAVRCMMEASFEVCKLSPIYETEPWDMDCNFWFLNMVAEVRTTDLISHTQMMARLLRIEYSLGRREKLEKLPRTIDLDLLFFGDKTLKTDFLTLPHPRLHLRRFVLVPLADIAPKFVHPVLRQEIGDLLARCKDSSGIQRWDPAHLHRRGAV